MREELQESLKRLMNCMNFAQSFFKRKNPFKALLKFKQQKGQTSTKLPHRYRVVNIIIIS